MTRGAVAQVIPVRDWLIAENTRSSQDLLGFRSQTRDASRGKRRLSIRVALALGAFGCPGGGKIFASAFADQLFRRGDEFAICYAFRSDAPRRGFNRDGVGQTADHAVGDDPAVWGGGGRGTLVLISIPQHREAAGSPATSTQARRLCATRSRLTYSHGRVGLDWGAGTSAAVD